MSFVGHLCLENSTMKPFNTLPIHGEKRKSDDAPDDDSTASTSKDKDDPSPCLDDNTSGDAQSQTQTIARKKRKTPPPYKLRIRCPNKTVDEGASTSTASTSATPTSTAPMPSKGKTQNWRDRLKLNKPEKYEELTDEGNAYSHYYRLSCGTAEQKLKKRNLSKEEREEAEMWLTRKRKNNESARKRMAKMNAKKKAEKKAEEDKPKKATTRQEHEKKKNYDTKRKQEQRAKLSAAEKNTVNKKRRDQYESKKEKKIQEKDRKVKEMAQQLADMEERLRLRELELREENAELQKRNNELHADAIDMRSSDARRKSLERAKRSMPKRRDHFVNTTSDLIKNSSPKKAAAFEEAGIISGETKRVEAAVMDAVQEGLKSPRQSSWRRKLAVTLRGTRKFGSQRAVCRRFKVSRHLIQKAKEGRAGSRQLPATTTKLVQEFFEANSNKLPDKKFVSKKTGKPRHIMDHTIAQLHTKYNIAHPQNKVGASSFYAHRPKHVKTKREANYIGCLCEYCENIELKVKCINHNTSGPRSIKDVYGISNSTMCPKQSGQPFHHPDCLQRKCVKCGVNELDVVLQPLMEDPDKILEWKSWDMVTTTVYGKKTKSVKKRSLVSKCGSALEFATALKVEAAPISLHLFNKDWQNQQERLLKSNLKAGEVMAVLDFAENYKCAYQREVQSAYYAQDSSTVHPIVTYYRCSTCDKSITESLVMISNDLHHDYHLVNRFQQEVSHYLSNTRGIKITKMYRYSDGCGNQYKSKGPFSDVSYAKEDYGFEMVHNFSGTRHGKGASDGESAVVKNHAANAVKAGTAVIKGAKDLHQYLQANLTRAPTDQKCCTDFMRTMFYIPQESVNRDRTHRDVGRVEGTRKIHCLKNVSGGIVAARNLSCFCEPCWQGNDGCLNVPYVQPWREVKLGGKDALHCKLCVFLDTVNY